MSQYDRVHVIERKRQAFVFSRDIEPALHIKSGETVTMETEDANAALIRAETDVYDDFAQLFEKAGGCNPVTGPIYVENARPGDCLAVKIGKIELDDTQGYTSVFPTLGALQSGYSLQPPHEGTTRICKIENNAFRFNSKQKSIKIPVDPFIGTIATAPKAEKIYSFYHAKEYCGNVDCPELREGTTVVLPVNVEGGLLSIGDVHAAQGDGEITGCALEIRGKVTVTIELKSKADANFAEWPQVNSANWVGSLGCPLGGSLDDAVRAAYLDLVNRLHMYHGFTKLEAYQLLNLVGKVTVGQVLEPLYSCAVKIDRQYLV